MDVSSPSHAGCLMVDLDGVQLPEGMSTIADPPACILWAIESLFPPEFRDLDFVYQLSPSAGLTKDDNQLNANLWFFTDRPFSDEELRCWAVWWNTKRQLKIIDPALYSPVQPHYVTAPGLEEGLVDPLAGRRLGWFRGSRRALPLYMPTSEEIAHERELKRRRVAAAKAAWTGGNTAELRKSATKAYGRDNLRPKRRPAPSWRMVVSEIAGRAIDGGRRALTYRHPDPMVEAVRFAICEGELLQAVGRGRGVQRDLDTPLNVLILTNVPIPVPVDELTSWTELRDMIGPIEALAARGVVPLDYHGMATALDDWFKGGDAAKEWFRYRPESEARLDMIRTRAKRGEWLSTSELVGIPFKNITKGNSHQLRPFRYRRSGDRQSNIVLVDIVARGGPHAAVEVVLGKLGLLKPITRDAEDDGMRESAESRSTCQNEAFYEAVRQTFEDVRPTA